MNPQPGKSYTIQDEDSLSQVAARAYGDATLWPRIWNANQTTLRSGDPDVIFPGEVILIPILSERVLPVPVTDNRDPEGIFIDLDGIEIRPITSKIIRTLDTVANASVSSVAWKLGEDIELDRRVQPYSYTPAKVSIGSEPIVSGLLYDTESKVTGGTTLSFDIQTPTIDLVHSTLKPPFEYANITLEDIIKKLIEPLGFSAIFEADTGGQFDRATAIQGESIFRFLSRLSKQRGVLLTCDTSGNIVIPEINVSGSPVATLEEGVTHGVTGWGSSYKGSQRFNVYRAVSQSPFGQEESIATDQKVPRSRFKTVSADESIAGNIELVATWARNKAIAAALSFSLKVEGWRDPEGKLWKENTIVTIVSPSMFLPNGFNFLVNRVEYILDGNGRSSRLSFVPPSLYTQGDIVEPW